MGNTSKFKMAASCLSNIIWKQGLGKIPKHTFVPRQLFNKNNRFCGEVLDGKTHKCFSLLLISRSSAAIFTQNLRNNSSSGLFSVVKDAISKEWTFPSEFLQTLSVNCGVNLEIRCSMTLNSSAVVRLMALQSSQNSVAPNIRIENEGGMLVVNTDDRVRDYFSLFIEVPSSCNVLGKVTGKCNVEIVKMESKHVDIWMESGDFNCSKLKCGVLTVKSDGGNISSNGSFHGSCSLETRADGSIAIDRFQGNDMNLKTEKGNIHTKAVYAERAVVQTTKGHITLGNLHADCKITTVFGNIHANGLTGSLTVDTEKGNVNVQACQPKMIRIISKEGNADVKLAGNIEPVLDLVGENISVDPCFEHPTGNMHNGTLADVIVRCPRGKIAITIQDWVSSLNLKA